MSERRRRGSRARARGLAAEEAAVRWLARRGYRVVERNLRTAVGEIDLIAWERRTLCFVEVKARSKGAWVPAAHALSATQRRRLVRAASLYLASLDGPEPACRFDVLTLDADEASGWTFELFENAFDAG